MQFSHVLVICRGNICRSPMAEALLANTLGGRITVSSAGTQALVDHPAAEQAVSLLGRRGLDISQHRARQLTASLAREADLLLIVEQALRAHVLEITPAARGKLYRLGEWRNIDIDDPYGQPESVFAECLSLIDQTVSDWGSRL